VNVEAKCEAGNKPGRFPELCHVLSWKTEMYPSVSTPLQMKDQTQCICRHPSDLLGKPLALYSMLPYYCMPDQQQDSMKSIPAFKQKQLERRLAEVNTQTVITPSHMKGRSYVAKCMPWHLWDFFWWLQNNASQLGDTVHSWKVHSLQKLHVIQFSINDCHFNSIKPAQTYVILNLELWS